MARGNLNVGALLEGAAVPVPAAAAAAAAAAANEKKNKLDITLVDTELVKRLFQVSKESGDKSWTMIRFRSDSMELFFLDSNHVSFGTWKLGSASIYDNRTFESADGSEFFDLEVDIHILEKILRPTNKFTSNMKIRFKHDGGQMMEICFVSDFSVQIDAQAAALNAAAGQNVNNNHASSGTDTVIKVPVKQPSREKQKVVEQMQEEFINKRRKPPAGEEEATYLSDVGLTKFEISPFLFRNVIESMIEVGQHDAKVARLGIEFATETVMDLKNSTMDFPRRTEKKVVRFVTKNELGECNFDIEILGDDEEEDLDLLNNNVGAEKACYAKVENALDQSRTEYQMKYLQCLVAVLTGQSQIVTGCSVYVQEEEPMTVYMPLSSLDGYLVLVCCTYRAENMDNEEEDVFADDAVPAQNQVDANGDIEMGDAEEDKYDDL